MDAVKYQEGNETSTLLQVFQTLNIAVTGAGVVCWLRAWLTRAYYGSVFILRSTAKSISLPLRFQAALRNSPHYCKDTRPDILRYLQRQGYCEYSPTIPIEECCIFTSSQRKYSRHVTISRNK